MIIPPTSVEQSGPGIDLSNQPEGVSIQMSDPVRDLEYARNAVTLTFDLSGFEHVRLSFKALEYGDEPYPNAIAQRTARRPTASASVPEEPILSL